MRRSSELYAKEFWYDLNEKEAIVYTKARMLGQDLKEVMDIEHIEQQILLHKRNEFDPNIPLIRISVRFLDNLYQPPQEDIKAYLTDLLKTHKYSLAFEVVKAQFYIFDDIFTDWEQIALDLAIEFNCIGYIKKHKNKILYTEIFKKKLVVSNNLQDAYDNFDSYNHKLLDVLKKHDSNYEDFEFSYYSNGFYYVVTKTIDGKKHMGVIGHTGRLLLPCIFSYLYPILQCKSNVGKYEEICDYLFFQREKYGLFGIMKIDGTVVVEPKFESIGDKISCNDFKHDKMVVAGNIYDFLGVFSLELNKFIIPCKYESIYFEAYNIECIYNRRRVIDGPARYDSDYYDYSGNLVSQKKV